MRNWGARAQLVAIAAALLVFVVVQVATAGPSGPSARESASVKSLNKQVKTLKKRVAALESRGATGPASGDLAGSYPAPSLAAPPAVTPAGLANVISPGSCSGVATNHWYNIDPVHSLSAGYYRDRQGRVFLQGFVIKCGGPPVSIFNLPPGFRPGLDANYVGSGLPGPFPLTVGSSTGSITTLGMIAGDAVSLDGISFRCAPSGANGCP